jgi:protein-S-isoprenylcysteine O-methyltransferase Ste14
MGEVEHRRQQRGCLMTTDKADDDTKNFTGSSKIRAIGRAATLASVVGAVLGVAFLINGWNWSETFTVVPYVAFEGGVAVFGLLQGRAKAWASWLESRGGEIFLPILGTWLYPVVAVLYGPTAGLPAPVFIAIYLWLAWSILSLRTNFSVLPEARALANKGPYRIVRHPMYLGYCALWVAWAAEARGGVGPWLWAALGILLFVYRAFVEEKKMRMFVPGYAKYWQKTPGFIPIPRPRRRAS